MALLEIQNLNRRFGGLHAVNDISFSVKQGMIKAVIGPNGAGKTTLFNLIAVIFRPTQGQFISTVRKLTAASPTRLPVWVSHEHIRI